MWFYYSSLLSEHAIIAYHQHTHEGTGKAYTWQDTQDTHVHGNVNVRDGGKILQGF